MTGAQLFLFGLHLGLTLVLLVIGAAATWLAWNVWGDKKVDEPLWVSVVCTAPVVAIGYPMILGAIMWLWGL